MSLAKHMTRVVGIGTLKEYTVDREKPSMPGRGIITADNGNQIRFTIFNKTNGDNQHTKAYDFADQFKEGDRVFITGQDGRQYSEKNDAWYESVNVWDYRPANDGEKERWVYVYVGDIKELDGNNMVLSYINYRDDEILFPINITEKTNMVDGILEVGARVKVKGTIFSGLEMDYFGDGDFVTKRTAAEINLLHTAEEVGEEKEEDGTDESGLWS